MIATTTMIITIRNCCDPRRNQSTKSKSNFAIAGSETASEQEVEEEEEEEGKKCKSNIFLDAQTTKQLNGTNVFVKGYVNKKREIRSDRKKATNRAEHDRMP